MKINFNMTKREEEILHLLEQDPLISQNNLAEKLGITRSSTGVHLSNLMKKGYIVGKGYILNNNPYICIVGGANIDIVGFPKHELINGDTNSGVFQLSLGGIGRNIAENLARLGIRIKFIAAIGDDAYGKQIIENCRELNIDFNDALIVKNAPSSVLIAIMDKKNDMALGLSAMDINKKLNVNFLQKKKEQIKRARLTVLDTNVSEKSLAYITSDINSIYFLDTVSTRKAKRAKNILDKIQYLKTNEIEASVLWGQAIENEADLHKASNFFHEKGIEKIFITRGEKGVFYSDGKNSGLIPANKIKVVNTNGAGDAFGAGVAYGIYKCKSTLECAQIGMMCAEISIAHKLNVNPEICEQLITQKL